MAYKVALDAFGSDRAPHIEIEGAVRVCEENDDIEIFLVGEKRILSDALLLHKKCRGKKIYLVDAPQRVTMHDKPSMALRKKPQSSIAVGLQLVANGQADAFVSAGNTGAVMAYSLKILRRLEGVQRPGIAALVPTLGGGFTIIIDVGANIQTKPEHLLQYALMGKIFMEFVLNVRDPRIGLLSIGEEASKGNQLIKESRILLEKNPNINFIGHVEGNHVLEGIADVIITDGFTGNVVLKFGEGAINVFIKLIKEEVKKSILATIAGLFLKPVFKKLKQRLNYEEYGGAPLLGVDGVVIIGHGRSTSLAIKNAILTAVRYIERDVNSHIKDELFLAIT